MTRTPFTVPSRLRPALVRLTRSRPFRLAAQTMAGALRVQIFDRAMTLAAQAFTSVFPVLILLGSILGTGPGRRLAGASGLPETSRRVLGEAFGHGGFSTFGVVGSLVVLVSSTGLARALARTHAAVWEIRKVPSGPRASWRWLIAVLTLATLMVISPVLNHTAHRLPAPHLSVAVLLLLTDSTVAILLPRLLLGRGMPVRLLVAGGIIFGSVMLAVRPIGSVYLPHALAASADRYGTIGVAFTCIGWLYVVAFCLLLSAVLGRALTLDEGLPGRLLRGSDHAAGEGPAGGRGRNTVP